MVYLKQLPSVEIVANTAGIQPRVVLGSYLIRVLGLSECCSRQLG